jgi:hypothetical protein
MTFEIANLTGATVTYAFQGKSHDLKPRMTVVQRTCAAGVIKLSKPGGFFSSATEIAHMPAEDGKRYTLKAGASGAVSVDIGTRAKSR